MKEKILPCCASNTQDIQKSTEFLKIITDPNRLQILCALKEADMCVCDIWKNVGISQNLASHHLKILKDFGLITARKNGKNMIYSSHTKTIKKNITRLNSFLTTEL